MAEASVAVKIPATIPPITTTNNIKLGKASTNLLKNSLKPTNLSVGYFLMIE